MERVPEFVGRPGRAHPHEGTKHRGFLAREPGGYHPAPRLPDPVKLERHPNARSVAARGADLVAQVIAERPGAALLLPAGETPVPLYAELARRVRSGALDLSGAHLFQLDELVGIPPTDARSFHRFLRDHMGPLGVRLHLLDGAAGDPAREIARHAEALERLGGADLVLLGLGRNGHVAFNEPGSRAEDAARLVELCPTTVRALSAQFSDGKAPTRGITIGLSEILAARRIALLVTGSSKAESLAALVRERPTGARPASLLCAHGDFLVLADGEACALLA